MNLSIKNKNFFPLIVFLLPFLFVGCYSGKTLKLIKLNEGVKIDQKLIQRCEEYWTALIHKNFEKTYKFEAPHIQYRMAKDKYILFNKNDNFDIQAVEIYSAMQLKQDLVDMQLKITYNTTPQSPVYKRERWILLNNKWYHVIEDKLRKMY